MNDRYHASLDSVAGQKCVVIYRNNTPIVTLWDGDNMLQKVKSVRPELATEIGGLWLTMRSLGSSSQEIYDAIMTLLRDKE
jgi:hypothetical protein